MNVPIYSGGIGINNKVEPYRLPFDRKTGTTAFEEATNVTVDSTGAVATVGGTELLESGEFHSFWAIQEGFYVVKNDLTYSTLYMAVVNADGSLNMQGVWEGLLLNNKLSYTDLDGATLYSNGTQHGSLEHGTRSVWPVSEWTQDDRIKVATPAGSHIDVLSGIVLVAVDDEVFFTEYGYPGLVDDNEGRRRFEGRVIMVASVQTGAYISTDKAVYFVEGTEPRKWRTKKVLPYPAIEYGRNQDLVDPSFFGIETTQLSVLFATVNGPVVGLPDGTAINLIDKQVKMPSCGQPIGSIMVVDESLIIQTQASA